MNNKVEFIAEVGSNWYVPGQSGLDRAKRLIESAAKNGANTVKFQMFNGASLYRDAKKAASMKNLQLDPSWLNELDKTCYDNGVELLVTPFGLTELDLIVPYVNRVKIASWDLTYTPLLEAVAEAVLPVLLSTGAATMEEIETAVGILRPEDGDGELKDITLLHCTGGYPTDPRDMVLNRIVDLGAEFFPCNVGLSSHCINPTVTASAVLLGATVIEVHYDLKDKLGAEAGHSYSPESFGEMVKTARLLLDAKDCNCGRTLVDAVARNSYYRDPSDWLRPVLNPQ